MKCTFIRLQALQRILFILTLFLLVEPAVQAQQVEFTSINWTTLGANVNTIVANGQTFNNIGATLGIPQLNGVNLTLRYVFDGSYTPCLGTQQQFYINGRGNINNNTTWTGTQFNIFDGRLTVTLSAPYRMEWSNMGTGYEGGESLSMGPVGVGSITSSHSGGGMVLTDDAISNNRAQCTPIVNYGFATWATSSPVTQIFAAANGGQGTVGLLRIGVPTYSISGNVFNDGNGLLDAGGARVNTSGTSAINPINGASSVGQPLYITLRNSTNNAVSTVPVSATGTYVFPNLDPGQYSTVLSTNSAGSVSANSPLPNGWDNTGEQIGTAVGGTDAAPNGIVTGITITNTNIANANFGINRRPVTVAVVANSQPNPGGNATSPVPSTLFSGTDGEDGAYPNNLTGRRVNLEPGTNGNVYYNGVLVTAGDPIIVNFNPTLVTVDPAGTSNQDALTVTFSYTVQDAAQVSSLPRTISLPFVAAPTYSISGNVFNDGNGLFDVGGALVNTSGTGAINPLNGASSAGQPLYITLRNSTNNAVSTVPVSATGTYIFQNLNPGQYSTVLSTNSAGSVSANSPLPDGWVNTGEQIGIAVGGTDGAPNGIVTGITITNTNIANANFGINRRPVTVAVVANSLTNPGGTATSPVPSTLFSGTDGEDGAYPNNLTGIRVDLEPGTNGNVYYNGVLVTAGDPIIVNFDPTLVTVDPAGTSNQDAVTVTFSYTVQDAAQVPSLPRTISIPFIADLLPVTLVSFTAQESEQKMVILQWSTTLESNSDKFQIETSTDAKTWNIIGLMNAQGYSSSLSEYSYTHSNPAKGENYYRLKMIDRDNTYTYSTIRSIQFKESTYSVSIYPNPVSNTIYIKGKSAFEIKEFILVNTFGQVIKRSDSVPTSGINVNNFGTGLYTLIITDKDGTITKHKVIIKK